MNLSSVSHQSQEREGKRSREKTPTPEEKCQKRVVYEIDGQPQDSAPQFFFALSTSLVLVKFGSFSRKE